MNNSFISKAFQLFGSEAPEHASAWMQSIQKLSEASALDEKTHALAYISVLAALRLESGIAYHVKHAKKIGATRDEIISAILVGLPAAGNQVTSSLPAAIEIYDAE